MNKIAVLLFCMSLSAITNAQVERGRYLVGGTVDISSARQGTTSNFNMSLTPSFGVFVVKGFAIGARYTFGINSARVFNNSRKEYVTTTTFNSGVGPLLKYYYGKKAVKGLVSANVNYLTTVTLRRSDVSGTTGLNVNGLVGMAYFLNPHIGLETGLYINTTSYLERLPITRIGVSAGFFVFLDKKKKE